MSSASAASALGVPPFGVYVHIPFCARRCDYCAFATWTDRSHLMERYASACRRELASADLGPATSVFFGGGTPSLLPAHLLVSILRSIDTAPGAEVTVECNPETVDAALLDAYVGAGVTRVSFGVQSMAAHVLVALGREHDRESVVRAAGLAAAAGFQSWSVDLIYGAAGESLDDWRATLEAVLVLEPPHVSAYALTVEPGTPLASDRARHPDDDDQADKYLLAEELLGRAGLEWYEISNWSRPGHQCRHNQLYWRQGDYQGIGCAAHSHDRGRRWWNVRTPERYMAAVEAGAPPLGGEEHLTPEESHLEGLQLSLRTPAGVDAAALREAEQLEGLVEEADEGRLRLTPRGRLLANVVAGHLR